MKMVIIAGSLDGAFERSLTLALIHMLLISSFLTKIIGSV